MHNDNWDYAMDNGGGWWWWWWWWIVMALMMVVFWGGVIWIGVTLLRRWNDHNQPPGVPTPSTAAASRPSAKEILDVRLARGEIEVDDFRKRLEALTDANTLHWHSIALRNDVDGIHDLTQAGVQPGEQFTNRFTVPDAGT